MAHRTQTTQALASSAHRISPSLSFSFSIDSLRLPRLPRRQGLSWSGLPLGMHVRPARRRRRRRLSVEPRRRRRGRRLDVRLPVRVIIAAGVAAVDIAATLPIISVAVATAAPGFVQMTSAASRVVVRRVHCCCVRVVNAVNCACCCCTRAAGGRRLQVPAMAAGVRGVVVLARPAHFASRRRRKRRASMRVRGRRKVNVAPVVPHVADAPGLVPTAAARLGRPSVPRAFHAPPRRRG